MSFITTPAVIAQGTPPGVFNFDPEKYPHLRLAMANLRSGGAGNLPVFCIGDSTTQGSNGINGNNAVQNSWVRRLAEILTKNLTQAGWTNCFGNHLAQLQGTTVQATDPRIAAFTAGWGLSASSIVTPGPGGHFFWNNSTTSALTFTPTVNTDTCDVYYLDGFGYDPFLVRTGLAGITPPLTGGTANISGASVVRKLTSTAPLAANVWTVQRAGTGGSCFPVGFSRHNSAAPEISLFNFGCASAEVSTFLQAANFWEALPQLTSPTSAFYGAPFAIVNLGINPWIAGTTYASMVAQEPTAYVTDLQAVGTDVLLVVPVPSATAFVPAERQANVAAAIRAVALALGCAYVDLTQRWSPQASFAALGYYADGIVHPSFLIGYPDMASAIAQFIEAF